MSIRLGNGTVVAGGTVSFPLLSTMWADHILNDVSWLRADTFSWQSGDVYKSVYEKLVAEYATGTEETEGAITFKRTDSGFKITESTQEQAILDLYNTTGVAWYYILDTTNKRFKLPRSKHNKYTSQLQAKGTGKTLGLTNGTQNIGIIGNQGDGGRCYFTEQSYDISVSTVGVGNARSGCIGLTTDATKSGIVADIPTQEMYLYFFVGNYVQNQTAIDIGAMSEQLNGKADVNLNNVSDFSKAITAMMPDYSAMTQIAFPYTAQKNGYILRNIKSGAYVHIKINNSIDIFGGAGNGNNASVMNPVNKNDVISNAGSGGTWAVYFIPCKGVN